MQAIPTSRARFSIRLIRYGVSFAEFGVFFGTFEWFGIGVFAISI